MVVLCASGYIMLVPQFFTQINENNQASIEVQNIILKSEGLVADNKINKDIFLKLQDIDAQIDIYKDKIANKLNEIAFRNFFIELNGGMQNIIGKKMILDVKHENNVYKMNNGYLTVIEDTQNDMITELAQNVIGLSNYVENSKMEFLYINAPSKNSKYDNLLPLGVYDYINRDADKFLELLSKNNVRNIDLRYFMNKALINVEDQFFSTDQHWKPEAGLWAAKTVFDEYLADYYRHSDFDVFSIDNYNIDRYNDIFLGSYGRRTGSLYGGVDDISIVTPKFNTNFRVKVPSQGIETTGDFEATIIDYAKLEKNYYNTSQYEVYMGGITDLRIIENDDGNGKKCLLINDSFGGVFAPFIAIEFSELHIIDKRAVSDFSIYDYIDYYEPDIVLVLFYQGHLSYDFELFNFRNS